MQEEILSHREYAHTHGMDSPEITHWRWSLPIPERG
jgi:xylulose-5-phosphate/fructose-6-phosphate phosphoketolase